MAATGRGGRGTPVRPPSGTRVRYRRYAGIGEPQRVLYGLDDADQPAPTQVAVVSAVVAEPDRREVRTRRAAAALAGVSATTVSGWVNRGAGTAAPPRYDVAVAYGLRLLEMRSGSHRRVSQAAGA
jgi:hypothetical protein